MAQLRGGAGLTTSRGFGNKLKLIECDVIDFYSVENAISDAQPDYIFHLAAQSFVSTSWRSPLETLHTNFL